METHEIDHFVRSCPIIYKIGACRVRVHLWVVIGMLISCKHVSDVNMLCLIRTIIYSTNHAFLKATPINHAYSTEVYVVITMHTHVF